MTQHSPTEDDISRAEAFLDKTVQVGERLKEELKSLFGDELRGKLMPIEKSVESVKGTVDDLRSTISKQARQFEDLPKDLRETRAELRKLIEYKHKQATQGDAAITENVKALEQRVAEERNEIENQVVAALNRRIQELELAGRRRNTIVLWVALFAFVLSLVGIALWAS